MHTPMQPQLRAYPYAYTPLPGLYYISTSLSHWLSWPLGSNRLWASVARTFKVGDWESPWLFWTLPDHPQARIQLFRRLDGADRILGYHINCAQAARRRRASHAPPPWGFKYRWAPPERRAAAVKRSNKRKKRNPTRRFPATGPGETRKRF